MTDRDPGRLPPPPRSYRWLVFACISVAMFANYYVFDALNPVGPHLEKELGFTQAQIGLLDSVYNIAALIVLLIGGIIIDRVGTKRALVAFGIVAAAGGLLIALSPGGYPGMAAGRFVLGMGSEPLIVAITTALAKWFKGKELSFAIALNLTFGAPRIGGSRQLAQLGVRVLHRVAAAAVPGRRHRGSGPWRPGRSTSCSSGTRSARTAWVTRAPSTGWRSETSSSSGARTGGSWACA